MATIVNQRDILIQATGTRLYTTTLGSEYLIPFDQVNGSTKPANNATVGAIAGTNLKDAAGTVLGDADVKNSVLVPSITAAATTSTWDGVSGSNKPHHYRIVAQGGSATGVPASPAVYKDGSSFASLGRSYALTVISRATQAITFHSIYDVYGTAGENTRMANDLNSLGTDVIVVIATNDEPYGNRLLNGLAAAMYRCGASRAVFGSADFQYRSAYALVGIPGCGEGNGFEGYQGKVASDTNAWIDMAFTIAAGNITGVSGGYKGAKEFVGVTIDQYGIKVANTLTGRVFFNANSTSPPWVVSSVNPGVSGAVDLVKGVDADDNTQTIKSLKSSGSTMVSATLDGNSVEVVGLGSEIDNVVLDTPVALATTPPNITGFSFRLPDPNKVYVVEGDAIFNSTGSPTEYAGFLRAVESSGVRQMTVATSCPWRSSGDIQQYETTGTSSVDQVFPMQSSVPGRDIGNFRIFLGQGSSSNNLVSVIFGDNAGTYLTLQPGTNLRLREFRRAGGGINYLMAARWSLPTSDSSSSSTSRGGDSTLSGLSLEFRADGTWLITSFTSYGGSGDYSGNWLSASSSTRYEIKIVPASGGYSTCTDWTELTGSQYCGTGAVANASNPTVIDSGSFTISIRPIGGSTETASISLSSTAIFTG